MAVFDQQVSMQLATCHRHALPHVPHLDRLHVDCIICLPELPSVLVLDRRERDRYLCFICGNWQQMQSRICTV